MGLFDFLRNSPGPPDAVRDIAALYQRLRPIRLRLNNELVRTLSRDALDEGAKKLGMLRGNMFVFENEDESSVLMDYCIYNVYRNGRNAIDRYVAGPLLNRDPDEMACLSAMQRSTYSLVVVRRIERDFGCQIQNLFTEEEKLLADVGFSSTARPGTLMATRLLDFDSFVTTSGAALPVGILDDKAVGEWQRILRDGTNDDRFDPAKLIRACLQKGASSRVRYESPDANRRSDVGDASPPVDTTPRSRSVPARRPAGKPAANRRCRCGSGKMFKNCCGKHQRQLRDGK